MAFYIITRAKGSELIVEYFIMGMMTEHDALQEAMQLLSKSMVSESELTRKLRLFFADQENCEGLIDYSIERLKTLDILNDYRTAEFIAGRHFNKGDRLIRQKLKSAGIDEINTAQVIAELGDERIRAKEAGLKKLSSYQAESSLQKEHKLIRFLSSRGFGADTCYAIVKEIIKPEKI